MTYQTFWRCTKLNKGCDDETDVFANGEKQSEIQFSDSLKVKSCWFVVCLKKKKFKIIKFVYMSKYYTQDVYYTDICNQKAPGQIDLLNAIRDAADFT